MANIYTEAQKRATLKWRLKNKEKWNLYMADMNYDYRHKDMEANRRNNNLNYRYRQDCKYAVISKLFLKILLP